MTLAISVIVVLAIGIGALIIRAENRERAERAQAGITPSGPAWRDRNS